MAVLVVSSEQDLSTDEVIDWLRSFQTEVYRINEIDLVNIETIELSEQEKTLISIGERRIALSEIEGFWYRRHNFAVDLAIPQFKSSFPFQKELTRHLGEEQKKTADYLHFSFLKKRSLGNYFRTNVNKLMTLDIARSCGLQIPPTIVTTKKTSVAEFKKEHTNIICKAISENILVSDMEIGKAHHYTNEFTDDHIEKLTEIFSLSLFQKKIEKKYELRIFYMHGEFYSMAIFSQADPKTKLDFRRYNFEKPNRTVPYRLPEKIAECLQKLMTDMRLDTGSIDMAVNTEGQFVFFEVNPVGQFGMTSRPCNYYLEQKIAKFLTNG